MITSNSIAPAVATGAAAGGALVLAQLVFEDLDTVESQAVGIVAAGAALTAYAARLGPQNQQIVVAYWMIAAVAGIPAVVAYWTRRQVGRDRQRAQRGLTIAERDYRANIPGPETRPGHR